MKKLSENEYWNAIFASRSIESRRSATGRLKRWIKDRILGGDRLCSYYSYLLWNSLFPKYLPSGAGLKAIEIGSAPGTFLVEMQRRRGYHPYGVEYTQAGVELNRTLFENNGISPENVIHQDFFSAEFHAQHAGRYDIVLSRGFIEHFDDARAVIDLHLNLLAPGGILVVSIPRFKGIYLPLMKYFYPANLEIHNLRIMEKDEFAQLFEDTRLTPQFCGYFGTLNLNLIETDSASFKRRLLTLLHGIQIVLNGALRALFGSSGKDTPIFSPYLMYIGVKG